MTSPTYELLANYKKQGNYSTFSVTCVAPSTTPNVIFVSVNTISANIPRPTWVTYGGVTCTRIGNTSLGGVPKAGGTDTFFLQSPGSATRQLIVQFSSTVNNAVSSAHVLSFAQAAASSTYTSYAGYYNGGSSVSTPALNTITITDNALIFGNCLVCSRTSGVSLTNLNATSISNVYLAGPDGESLGAVSLVKITLPSATNGPLWSYVNVESQNYWCTDGFVIESGQNDIRLPEYYVEGINPRIFGGGIGYTRTEKYENPNSVTLPSGKAVRLNTTHPIQVYSGNPIGNYVQLPTLGQNGRSDLKFKKLSLIADDDYRGDLDRISDLHLDGLDQNTMTIWGDKTISCWSDKKIRKLENQFLYSDDLTYSTGRYVGGVTISENLISAPNDIDLADKLVEDSSTGNHYIGRRDMTVISGVQYAFSVYAKAAERNRFQLSMSSGGGGIPANVTANFDITPGTLGQVTLLGSRTDKAEIEHVGNNWFKCTVYGTATSASSGAFAYILLINEGSTIGYTGTTGSGIYFWGRQYRRSHTLDTFVSVTDTKVTAGTIHHFVQSTTANRPYLTRADNLENRLVQSEDISTTWVAANLASVTATRMTEATDVNQTHSVAQTIQTVKGASYTFSADIKAGTRIWARISGYDGTSSFRAYFRVDGSPAIGTTDAGVTATQSAIQADGSYRCSITFTANASSASANVAILLASADNTVTYNGNGSYIDVLRTQLRRSSTSSTYLATTTYPQYAGFLTNPDNAVENRILYSNDISKTEWIAFNTTKSGTGVILEKSSGASLTEHHYVYTYMTEQTYPITLSLEARSIGGRRIGVGHQGDICVFDLETRSIISSFGSTTIYSLGDDWSKIEIRNFTPNPVSSSLLIYTIHPSGTTWQTQQIYAADSTKGVEVRNIHVRVPSASDTFVSTTSEPIYAHKSLPYFPSLATYLASSNGVEPDFSNNQFTFFSTYSSDGPADSSNVKYILWNEWFNNNGYNYAINTNGVSWFRTNQSATNTVKIGSLTISPNTMTLASIWSDSTDGQWYRNGTADGSLTTCQASLTATVGPVRLGHTSQSFIGYITDIQAYRKKFDTSEWTVKTNYLRSSYSIVDRKTSLSTKQIQFTKSDDLIITFLPKFNITFGPISDYPGYWQNNDGFLNTNKYIQDSDYYQQFSYELRAGESFNTYEKVMKKLLHPAGYKMFGLFDEEIVVDSSPSLTSEQLKESAGLVLWLDSTDLTTLTVAGDGTISEWRDKSSYGPENVLTYSEDSSNWATAFRMSTSTTGDTTIPTGYSSINKCLETISLGTHGISSAETGKIESAVEYTASLVYKAISRTQPRVYLSNGFGANAYADFDVTTKTSTTGSNATSSKIQQLENDWYLLQVSATSTGSHTQGRVHVYATPITSYTGSVTSGFYATGIQIRKTIQSLSGYVKTTSSSIYSGGGHHFTQSTTANRPYLTRADNLENRLVQSENLQTTWTPYRATATSATRMVEDSTASSEHRVSQTVESVKGAQYVATIRAQSSDRYLALRTLGMTSDAISYFNLVTGAVVSKGAAHDTATITAVGDGSYDCQITFTASASSTTALLLPQMSADGSSLTYNGNGTSYIDIFRSHFARTGKGYVTTTTYPQYAGLNGRQVVYFPGAASYMSRAFTAALDIGVGDNTLLAVAKLDTGEDPTDLFYLLRALNSPTAGFRWYVTDPTTLLLDQFATANGSSDAMNSATTTAQGGTLLLHGFTKSGTTGQFYLNGAAYGNPDTINNAASASGLPLYLGGIGTGGLRGYLNELKTYIAAIDPTTEHAELLTKWNIS